MWPRRSFLALGDAGRTPALAGSAEVAASARVLAGESFLYAVVSIFFANQGGRGKVMSAPYTPRLS